MYKAPIQLNVLVDNNIYFLEDQDSAKSESFRMYLRRGVILTKEKVAKRNWHGYKRCVFYQQDETIKHLFFH
jgi:hypothetical protein